MAQKRKNTATRDTASKKARRDISNALLDIPNDAVSRSTRSKSKSTEPSLEPAESTERAPKKKAINIGGKMSETAKKAGKGNFELVGERDHLKVGTPAPEGLVLTFRNKITKEETTYKYSKKEKEIDWNDKEQVEALNKWRLGLFSRKLNNTTKGEKVPWVPQETAYLELMYRKLSDKASSDKNAPLPHTNKIREAFNEFFVQRDDFTDEAGNILPERDFRDPSSFGSYVNRKGSTIKNLRGLIQKRLKDKGDSAWIPNIGDAEIAAHLGWMQIAAVTKSKNILTVGTKRVVAPAESQAKKQSQSNVVSSTSTKYLPSAAVSKPKPKDKPTKNNKVDALSTHSAAAKTMTEPKDITDVPKPRAHTNSQLTATQTKLSEPKKPFNADLQAPIRTTHQERPVTPTPPEKIEKLLKEGFESEEVPSSDAEAIKKHLEEGNRSLLDGSHIMQAGEDLEARMGRRGVLQRFGTSGSRNRDRWASDWISALDHGKGGAEENWHVKSARVVGAANVNGIYGAAIAPPLGYTGTTRNLVENRLLPDSELLLADKNAEAIKKVYARSDQEFEKANTSGKKQRSTMDEDSDETGDESCDE
jgi:hypothetical protein